MMIRTEIADGVAVLWLENRPANAISLELLEALCEAVRSAGDDPAVRGVVITAGASHFSVGADVNLFRGVRGSDDAVELSRVFQEAYQKIEDSSKPIAAAVGGGALGGAVELALACHLRLTTPKAKWCMPEVTLGINPGAGGTQRLARLIGPEPALRLLLCGHPIDADRAAEWGLVDEICPPEELIERAKTRVLGVTEPRRTSQLAQFAGYEASEGVEAAIRACDELLGLYGPRWIAPRTIVEAVRAGLEESVEAGMAAEQEGFARCMETSPVRNKIRMFLAIRSTGSLPELAEVESRGIERAAVVGMGTMGTGIAQALLQAGLEVVVVDERPEAVERGEQRIAGSLERRVAKGRLDRVRAEEILGRLSMAGEYEAVGESELVIESVFEDLSVKRDVLERIERRVGSSCVLGTNTSTLLLEGLSAGLERAERLVGLHFFNPAHAMPLVEVVRGEATSLETLRVGVDLVKRLGKRPVVVGSRPGFVVNRIFVPYLIEAFWLWQEGCEAEAIDRAMVAFGFPMGPLALTDMAGLDILATSHQVLSDAFPWHGPLPAVLRRLIEAGRLGQKTGGGVYDYAPGDHTPRASTLVERTVACGEGSLDEDRIAERLILRMVGEATHVLREGIARDGDDIDVAMVLGTGFPDDRGGVIGYIHEHGPERLNHRLVELSTTVSPRYTPAAMVRP